MQAGVSPAQAARARHRHELRTLIYVTFDQWNGGVIRNLTREGIGVQTVAAVRPGQQLRVRFGLPPRLRFDARGEVVWADSSGQCGIRFLDLSPRMARRLDEWVFGELLENAPMHRNEAGSTVTASFSDARLATIPLVEDEAEDDGLIVSPSPVKVIELPARPDSPAPVGMHQDAQPPPGASAGLDWLSQPLSRRGLAWLVNTLTLVAAVLLFVLVFISVTRELPRWPVAMAGGAAMVVAALYWAFFKLFGGASPGARLARLAGSDREDEEQAGRDRFR
jgi:hypothetical protein